MRPDPLHHRPFGNTSLRIPPIVFGTGALANARRVIPDRTKFELCGEWFRHVAPPVAIDMSPQCGDGSALELLARAVRRLEIAPDEVVFINRFGCNDTRRTGGDAVRAEWEAACRLLGDDHRPQLVAIDAPDAYLAAAQSAAERDERFQDILDTHRALLDLKAQRHVAGVGVAARDWRVVREIDAALPLDWLMLLGSFTIMRHPPELLEFMSGLAARQIPIVCAGIFDCDFLTGGSTYDSRAVSPENPAEQPLFAWRKAFVALCHGHGVTPVQACIQFALAAPGVVAVVVNSSRPQHVAENVASSITQIPNALWHSMQEEGLLSGDYPYVA